MTLLIDIIIHFHYSIKFDKKQVLLQNSAEMRQKNLQVYLDEERYRNFIRNNMRNYIRNNTNDFFGIVPIEINGPF